MYLNNFSISIPEGKELEGGYVKLTHNTIYRIILGNHKPLRCDAYLEIDGKHVGTWRIYPHQSVTLERPAHDDGCFTFYQIGTKESNLAGLVKQDPNLGLIKVVFTPELIIPEPEYMFGESARVENLDNKVPLARSSANFAPGGTGLSGKSEQQFINVGAMELDNSQRTEINLRLVALITSHQPRPLTSFSTPVPPPIK